MTKNARAEGVLAYARDVVSGKEMACKWVRKACLRHLRDLERQKTKDFPYEFREDLAERFLRFSELCSHIEGPLDVVGTPIILPPFWVFICGSVFGWVRAGTEKRRFRKMYVRIARKNSKSTVCAIISLYLLTSDREGAPQIYNTATKRDQAKIVFDCSKKMAEKSVDILKRVKPLKQAINHRSNGGFIKALSKETRTLDGFNPHGGIIDEYHAHLDASMQEVLVSGMVMREQPLLVIITTAGFLVNGPCKVEDEYVERILDEAVSNEEYFGIIYTLDDEKEIHDEAAWYKANPLVSSTEKGLSALRTEYREAKDVPEKMRNFLTKNMNLWQAVRANGYMDMERWKKCEIEEIPDDLVQCIYGVDLSVRIDLTSLAAVFKKDGLFYIFSHSFMPRERFERAIDEDKAQYDLWEKQGLLTVTDGAITDYEFITSYIQELEVSRGWKPTAICYDPAFSHYWAEKMAEFYTMVSVRQGMLTLAAPTADLRDQVYAGKVRFEKNGLLTWAMANAIVKTDHKLNIMLDKSKSRDRIDPADALIAAWEQVYHGRLEDGLCVYNTRGVITV